VLPEEEWPPGKRVSRKKHRGGCGGARAIERIASKSEKPRRKTVSTLRKTVMG
jgi:hypothetical protein